jgi:predicted RNase H-like nuclease (RuvC/YqgF family)
MKLNEFDIVVVYPESQSGFVAIGILQQPQIKKYYAKEGIFSFSTDDILLATKLNKDYQQNKGYVNFVDTKKTIKTVDEAVKSESAIEYIDQNIKNISQAIEKIEQVKKEINEALKDFKQETRLKSFITEYFNKADSTISELNNFTP